MGAGTCGLCHFLPQRQVFAEPQVKNLRFFIAATLAGRPLGKDGRKGGIAMMEMMLKRLNSEEILMEAFRTHIAPAVLGGHRLPDGKQLCR
jgi:hypothetical protein